MANTMGIDYAEDTREQIDDAGQTCTLGSASRNRIACVASDERRTANIDVESPELEIFERELTIMAGDVSAVPAQNSTVVFTGFRYYVYDIQHDTEAESILLYLRRNADGRIA
jgi:hypothetical protein